MKASLTDLEADAILAKHPDFQHPVLTSSQLHRISRTEVSLDPTNMDYAHNVINKDDRVDTLRINDRERKRRQRANEHVAE